MAKDSTKDEKGITIKKEDDLPEWYTQVVVKSQLADYAPIKGCMVLRPNGCAIWEKVMHTFDAATKRHGVRNAYFPMFIPESFFHKEAEHAQGFEPEVAWIEKKADSSERYAIRPTSETIITDFFRQWVRSWRDLPLKINQWTSVCRWETQDCKLFIRSREFLWQEGHCVYASEEECHTDTLAFLEEYRKIMEDLLAFPVILGRKTDKEKFAGALSSYTIEGFMPDGKALQLGTSHDLGQGFAKAFEVKYLGTDGGSHTPWQNSWGISWRTIGALVMIHSDNKGLVLPPSAAPNQVVIIPISYDQKPEVLTKAKELQCQLFDCNPLLDDREGYTPGWKYNDWELKGVPIRIEIGPKDLEKNQAVVVRRDTGEKKAVPLSEIKQAVQQSLQAIQQELYQKAKQALQGQILSIKTWAEFEKALKEKKMAFTTFCGDLHCEEEIKEKTSATSRCLPLNNEKAPTGSVCFHCGKEAAWNVYFAKNY